MAEEIKLDPKALKDLAAKIIAEIKATSVDIKGMRGLRGAFALAPRVVAKIEEVRKIAGLTGAQSRDIAISVILELVPDQWLPDWVLAPLLSWAIGKAVDLMKSKLKK